MSESSEKCEETSETLYNEIIRLHNLNERTIDIINEKTNGIIVFDSAIITLTILASVQLLNIKNFTNIQYLIILTFIPLIFIMCSLKSAINSYSPSDYKQINVAALYDKYFHESKVNIMDQISVNNKCNISENKVILNKNIKLLEKSIKYLEYGILLLIICFIIIFLFIAFNPQLINLFLLIK